MTLQYQPKFKHRLKILLIICYYHCVSLVSQSIDPQVNTILNNRIQNNIISKEPSPLTINVFDWSEHANDDYIELSWRKMTSKENLGLLIYKGLKNKSLKFWKDYRRKSKPYYTILERAISSNQIYAYLLSDVRIHDIRTDNNMIKVDLDYSKRFTMNPNPIVPEIQIVLNLDSNALVQIDSYNSMGDHIDSIIQNNLQEGEYVLKWDASTVLSGFYMVTVHYDNALTPNHEVTIL